MFETKINVLKLAPTILLKIVKTIFEFELIFLESAKIFFKDISSMDVTKGGYRINSIYA
jgi:hypothetical protein